MKKKQIKLIRNTFCSLPKSQNHMDEYIYSYLQSFLFFISFLLRHFLILIWIKLLDFIPSILLLSMRVWLLGGNTYLNSNEKMAEK